MGFWDEMFTKGRLGDAMARLNRDDARNLRWMMTLDQATGQVRQAKERARGLWSLVEDAVGRHGDAARSAEEEIYKPLTDAAKALSQYDIQAADNVLDRITTALGPFVGGRWGASSGYRDDLGANLDPDTVRKATTLANQTLAPIVDARRKIAAVAESARKAGISFSSP